MPSTLHSSYTINTVIEQQKSPTFIVHFTHLSESVAALEKKNKIKGDVKMKLICCRDVPFLLSGSFALSK